MNYYFSCLSLFLLIVSVCTAGCSKVEERIEDIYLQLNPQQTHIEFVADEEKSYTFAVETNSKIWDIESSTDWCTIEKDYDINHFTVKAVPSFAENIPDTATLTVTADGADPIIITATLNATPFLDIETDESIVFYAGAKTSYTLPIHSNTDWEYSLQPEESSEWCLIQRNGSDNLIIEAQLNDSSEPREATLTVFAKNVEEQINIPILQKGMEIFIAGTVGTGEMSYKTVYWKNGEQFDLNPGMEDVTPYAMAVNDDDVHVVGMYIYGYGYYFKNDGTAISIPGQGEYASNANGIYIDKDGSVCISGYVQFRDQQRIGYDATYIWKDGTYTELSPENTNDLGISMAVDGEDTYVFSYNNDGIYYYKNQEFNKLGQFPGQPNDITAHNGEIYVAGMARDTEENWQPYYAIGQQVTSINDYHNDTPLAIDIDSYGNVHMAGWRDNGYTFPPYVYMRQSLYWKNGELTILTSDESGDSQAWDIITWGDDVYIVGYDGNSGVMWKNGEIELNISSEFGTKMCCIYIR